MVPSCDCKRGQGSCIHYNLKICFPALATEWSKRNKSFPDSYTPGSDTKVWWKCSIDPCGCHEWFGRISHRTNMRSGCPLCAHNGRCCPHTNFKVSHPLLVEKFWDLELNTVDPTTISSRSMKRIHWKCDKCSHGCHRWVSTADNLHIGKGCPFCAHLKVCAHDSFASKYPHVAGEFDKERNGGIDPKTLAPHSHVKAWWKCSKCDHGWITSVKERTSQGHGCPRCNTINTSKLCAALTDHLAANHPLLVVEREVRFQGCRSINSLPFDFYIPSAKLLIELDGQQHFFDSTFVSRQSTLQERQRRDLIKTEYAFRNRINFLRVSYMELSHMREIFDYVVNNIDPSTQTFFCNVSCGIGLMKRTKPYLVDKIYEEHEHIYGYDCFIDVGHKSLRYIDDQGNEYIS